MTDVLRAVPIFFWVAAAWIGLALWVDDIRGIYIAVFCAVLEVVQLFRSAD